MYRIRGHHGMCLGFYEGKGYSDGFTGHMWEMKRILEEDQEICLADGTDDICSACPRNCGGVCDTPEHVAVMDRQVLMCCGLAPGDVIRWKDFELLVKERILDVGKRKEICGECQWSGICDGRTV